MHGYTLYTDIFTDILQSFTERSWKGLIIMIGGIWYRVPERILQDPELTRSDIAVFAVIADRADGDTCTMSSRELAELTSCCVRTVKTATKRLSERGYISVQHATGAASTYKQLLLEPKRRKRQQPQGGAEDDIHKYDCLINKFEIKGEEVG